MRSMAADRPRLGVARDGQAKAAGPTEMCLNSEHCNEPIVCGSMLLLAFKPFLSI